MGFLNLTPCDQFLTNADVEDLYSRVQVGAKVVVLPQAAQTAQAPAPRRVSAHVTNERMSWNVPRSSGLY